MAKFFGKSFASGGTRTSVPDLTQSDGSMSFPEGWGYDYERNPITDPKSKSIERGKMNYMFFVITEAIGELQRQGASTWDEEKMPYTEGSTCWYANKTWISLVSGNKDKPGVTEKWKDISKGGDDDSGGFDKDKYYTKEEINKQMQSINDSVNNISLHEVGDIYPISRLSVTENEFVCNGDTIPISSNIGQAFLALPADFKTAWGIKKIGTQRIKLPMLITKEAVDGVFSVATFNPMVGIDRTKPQYYVSDTTEQSTGTLNNVTHIVSRFLPVIYVPKGNESSSAERAVYFEGTDNLGEGKDGEIVVRQLRFGLYTFGERYIDPTANITGALNTLFLYDKAGAQIPVTAAGTAIDNTEAGVLMIVTLNKSVSAATMTAIGYIKVPDPAGGTPNNVSFSLTKEALI